MAKVYLEENQIDSAYKKATQALQLLQQYLRSSAITNTYQTLSAIYKKQNKPDSSDHYLHLYHILRDSTEAAVATSNSEIIQLRVDDDSNISKIELLQTNQKTEKTKRNIYLGLLLGLFLLIYLYYNRLYLKQKHQKEGELKIANEQM